MYVHQQDWVNAARVAETYDPTALADVYTSQARSKVEAGDFKAAEEIFISVSRPELALAIYQEQDMWQEALRIAQAHLPHKVQEVSNQYKAAQARQGKGTSKGDFISTGKAHEAAKKWTQAIDTYLSANRPRVEAANDLEDIWLRAIDVARNYVPNRTVEVRLYACSNVGINLLFVQSHNLLDCFFSFTEPILYENCTILLLL